MTRLHCKQITWSRDANVHFVGVANGYLYANFHFTHAHHELKKSFTLKYLEHKNRILHDKEATVGRYASFPCGFLNMKNLISVLYYIVLLYRNSKLRLR